jgi:hypothetical protein
VILLQPEPSTVDAAAKPPALPADWWNSGTNVVGPTAQNVNAGDFSALLAALQSNTVYGNIHTTKFPAGEIRGQVQNPSTNN